MILDNCFPPMPASPHNNAMYSNGGPPCSVHPHNQLYNHPPVGYGNQCNMHPMYSGQQQHQSQNHYYPHASSLNVSNMQNMQNMQNLTYSTISHAQSPQVSLPHSKSLDQYENNIQVCLFLFVFFLENTKS